MKTNNYENFEEWYKSNERSFFCGQLDDNEIAYASYLAGMKSIKEGELIDFGFFIAMYPFYESGTPGEIISTHHYLISLLDKEQDTYNPKKVFEMYEEWKKDYYYDKNL